MLKLVTGRINSGKTTYVQNIIKQKIASGAERVYLIVPEQFSFESERRMLMLLGEKDAMKVEVCSFSRLAENILGDIHGATKLDEAGRVALMSTALEETADKLNVYGRFSRSIGVVSEMLNISSELKKCAVTPLMLEETANKLEEGMLRKKLGDLSVIMSAFNALVARRFTDSRDDLTLLADNLLDNRYFDGITVVIDGFKGFTAQEYDVISRIVSQSDEIYITLCLDEIYASEIDLSVFSSVRDTAKKLIHIGKKCSVDVEQVRVPEYESRYASPAIEAIEKNLYSIKCEAFDGDISSVNIHSCTTAYDECEYVALTVKKLLREENYRCRDIAIISRSEGEYSKNLRAALKRHGVPVFEDKRRPLATQPPVVLTRAALEIASRGFSTDAVFRVLKTQLTELDVEQVSELENYVYLWKIDGKKWLDNWNNHPLGLGQSLNDSDREKLVHLNELRERCVAPLVNLRSEIKKAYTATDILKALYNYLVKIKAPENLKKLAISLNSFGETEDAAELGRVWDRLMEIFGQLSVALAESKVSCERISDLFTLVLGVQDIGVIPHGIDEITIGAADRIRVNRPRAVFAVGVNDGVFPKKPSSGRVLSDADRQLLTDMGVDVAAPSQNDFLEERFIAYNSLCCASERLYVSYCLTDFSGAEKSPSELIGQLRRILPGCKIADSTDALDMIQSEASAFDALASGWHSDSVLESTLKAYFDSKPEYANRISALERASGKTEFSIDDNKTSLELFGQDIYVSATKIEDYGRCPFLYFCRHGLKLNERRTAEIDAMLSGIVVHFVLENIVSRFGKKLVELSFDEVKEQVVALLDEFLRENLGAEQRDERFDYLYRRLCDSICVVVTRLVNEMRLSDFEPADFELRIGGKDAQIKQFEIGLDDGGKVILSGQVDRVDVLKTQEHTFVRVMDYKTGSKKFNLTDVLNGLNMQMLLYLFAIKANGRERYGDVVPAGVLYVPAKSSSGRIAKDTPKEDIQADIIKDGRFSGILLDDDRVIHGTDTENTGTVIAQRKKGVYENLINLTQLSALEKTVTDTVRQMGDYLHLGKIPALPKYGGSYSKPACEYCAYKDICLHEESSSSLKFDNMKFSECLEILEEGDENAELD